MVENVKRKKITIPSQQMPVAKAEGKGLGRTHASSVAEPACPPLVPAVLPRRGPCLTGVAGKEPVMAGTLVTHTMHNRSGERQAVNAAAPQMRRPG